MPAAQEVVQRFPSTRPSTGWTRMFSRASVCCAAAAADTLTRSGWR